MKFVPDKPAAETASSPSSKFVPDTVEYGSVMPTKEKEAWYQPLTELPGAIGEKLKMRGERLMANPDVMAKEFGSKSESGKAGGFVPYAISQAGELAGGLTDIAGETMVKAGHTYAHAFPEEYRTGLKNKLTEASKAVAENPTVQDMGRAWSELEEYQPGTAELLRSVGNITGVVPAGKIASWTTQAPLKMAKGTIKGAGEIGKVAAELADIPLSKAGLGKPFENVVVKPIEAMSPTKMISLSPVWPMQKTVSTERLSAGLYQRIWVVTFLR
jgi:hypothetical protein